MNRTLSLTPARILGSFAFGTMLLAAGVVHAEPTKGEAEGGTLQSKLGDLLGRPGGLTSSVVAARAEETSFDVKSRREELNAAAAAVDQALVAYFPKLTATGRYMRLSPLAQPALGTLVVAPNDPPGQLPPNPTLVNAPFAFPIFLNQAILQASLNIPLSDYILRIPQNYSAATKNVKASELVEQATRLRIAADAKSAYYTWVRAKLQEVVTEQAVAQSKGHLVDAQHAFEAGTASKADVLRIESQLAGSRLMYQKAQSFADTAETQIRIAMHDPGATSYEVGESVDAEVGKIEGIDNLTTMWGEATANRLELRALDQSIDSFRDQAKVARAGAYPRLDAFGDVIYSNPNQRIVPAQDAFKATWDVGAQLSFSPNDIASAGATSRQLTAKASSFLAQRQALADGVRLEVTQARNALRDATAAIESTALGLSASEESYRVRRSLFKNGRATGIELTDAESDLTRSRLEAINARVDLRVALVRVEHALGRDIGTGETSGAPMRRSPNSQ